MLLPKEGQFVVFAAFILWWSIGNRQFIRVNKVTVWFLAYAGIHLVSIIVAVVTRDYELNRIAAAFNTCGIWMIAVWIAGIVSQEEGADIDRIGKYCLINIGIMFALMLVTWIPGFSIHIGSYGRTAWTWDLLSSGETTRFAGMMEYPTLVCPFIMLQFPWAFKYLAQSRYKWSAIILIPISFAPVFMTYSRMGSLAMLLMCFAAVNCFLLKYGFSFKKLLMVYAGFAIIVIIVCVIKADTVIELAGAVLNARPGSNSDRMRIYMETIAKINETSWVIGAGIKEMNSIGLYPLGSHCTYLGMIYKAGILGAICALIGLVRLLTDPVRRMVKTRDWFDILFIASIGVMLFFFILEDIDGADWLLVMSFVGVTIPFADKWAT